MAYAFCSKVPVLIDLYYNDAYSLKKMSDSIKL